MPLSHSDWTEIQNTIRRMASEVGEPFVQGKVIKVDPKNKTVFLAEFGDTPIPLVAHHYQITYNSRDSAGRTVRVKTNPYTTDVDVLVPRVGEIVLVAQHLGSRALPKCLGVIQSTNYVVGE